MAHSHMVHHTSENIACVDIDVGTCGGREDMAGNIHDHMDHVGTKLGMNLYMEGNYEHKGWSTCGHMSMFDYIPLYMVYEVNLDDILHKFLGTDDHR